MRLIDADALRKELRKKNLPISGADVYFVRKLIDNAPTIAEELGATCLAKRNENGQLEAIISLDNAPTVERSQGEWEYYSGDFYKCPECGYLLNKLCPQCHNKVILPKDSADVKGE